MVTFYASVPFQKYYASATSPFVIYTYHLESASQPSEHAATSNPPWHCPRLLPPGATTVGELTASRGFDALGDGMKNNDTERIKFTLVATTHHSRADWVYILYHTIRSRPIGRDTKFTVRLFFLFMYGYEFLSRDFTDRRKILHGGSAWSRTGLLPFWGITPGTVSYTHLTLPTILRV